MSVLREFALSFLSKPTSDYQFSDSAGFVTQVLKCAGSFPEDHRNLSAQELFDHFHTKGGWNRFGFGSLAFYGRGVLEIGHVGLMLDAHSVLTAHHSLKAFQVRVRPIHFRPGFLAAIKPDYSLLGWI